jgi:hypothetical protein
MLKSAYKARKTATLCAAIVGCAMAVVCSTSQADESKSNEAIPSVGVSVQDCPGKELFKPFHVALSIGFRSVDEKPDRSSFRDNITNAVQEELARHIDIIPRDRLYRDMYDNLREGTVYRGIDVLVNLSDTRFFVGSSNSSPEAKTTLPNVSVTAWRYLVMSRSPVDYHKVRRGADGRRYSEMSRSPVELADTSVLLALPRIIEGSEEADYSKAIVEALHDAICSPVDTDTLIWWGSHE